MRKERKYKPITTPHSAFNIDRRAERILQTYIEGFCVAGLNGRINMMYTGLGDHRIKQWSHWFRRN
ncbi:MAG: hypothetical protein ACYSSP_09830 [Planctomycetota bacterium]